MPQSTRQKSDEPRDACLECRVSLACVTGFLQVRMVGPKTYTLHVSIEKDERVSIMAEVLRGEMECDSCPIVRRKRRKRTRT